MAVIPVGLTEEPAGFLVISVGAIPEITGQGIIMVMGEHEKRLHELSLIALADSNPGSLGRPGQGGQQQRGQDGDDGDHNQQFN